MSNPVLKIDPLVLDGTKELGNNGIIVPISEYVQKFRDTILDQATDYPAPEPIINIIQRGESIPFLTLKSFSLWQGKQKSRKTTLLAIAVAAFIADYNDQSSNEGTFLKAALSGVVLVFDTEQGQSYAARTMKLMLKLANVTTTPRLIYSDLREHSPGERIKIIVAAIESTPEVRFVIIDGLVDLLVDFMEAKSGHDAMTEILRLCSKFNIHVAGVLHQNKQDKNARAHIGTIASQKCEMEISTEVDPDDRNQSLVTCVNSRGLPFEQFALKWEKGSLPVINNEWNQVNASDKKASKNYERSKQIAEEVFKPLAALSHSEATQQIMSMTKKSEATAKRFIKEFVTWKLITKGEDGHYRINTENGVRVHEGSKEVS